jgi:hypothetical protein
VLCDVHRRTAELIKNIRRLIGFKCYSPLASFKSSFPKCRTGFGADTSDAVRPHSRAPSCRIAQDQASCISALHAARGLDSPRHIVDFLIQQHVHFTIGELLACGRTSRGLHSHRLPQATRWRHFALVLRDHGNEAWKGTLWLATAGVSKRQAHGRYEMKNDLCTKEARTSKSACGTRTCKQRVLGPMALSSHSTFRVVEMANAVLTSHSSHLRHFTLLPCR